MNTQPTETAKRPACCGAAGCTETDDLQAVVHPDTGERRTLCRGHRKDYLGVTS